MKSDPYHITRRIDWTRHRLSIGQPVNSTYIAAEFEISPRTAARDMRYIRQFYKDQLGYDFRERTYYLK